MRNPDTDRCEFLTVGEAAERLGLSRLRVREAVARGALRGRIDNEGLLRVDVPDTARIEDGPLDPADVLGFLFDELEEREALDAAKDARLAALADLSNRQADALDRAGAALEASVIRENRLSDLLDRAMAHLERPDAAAALDQTARFDALLTRAIALAEARDVADRDKVPDLAPATDRAFGLLEEAVARAEASQSAADQSSALLDRALAAGEDLEAQVTDHARTIARQDQTLQNTLRLSERAVALAAAGEHKRDTQTGFLGWLFATLRRNRTD